VRSNFALQARLSGTEFLDAETEGQIRLFALQRLTQRRGRSGKSPLSAGQMHGSPERDGEPGQNGRGKSAGRLVDLTANEPQLFRSQRPVDRALGFCYGLGFGRTLASEVDRFERNRPFPELPPDTLNDRIFDISISHGAQETTPALSGPGPRLAIRRFMCQKGTQHDSRTGQPTVSSR
jgi:hypothetical protein